MFRGVFLGAFLRPFDLARWLSWLPRSLCSAAANDAAAPVGMTAKETAEKKEQYGEAVTSASGLVPAEACGFVCYKRERGDAR